jgi:DEAD/DEAH box helicase domain-containing protein
MLLGSRCDVGGLNECAPVSGEQAPYVFHDEVRASVDGFIEWVRNREYYRDQIQFQRAVSDRCPACIQSPHCGRANEPLEKRLAATVTMALADPR